MGSIYRNIDKEQKEACVEAFNELEKLYMNGDLIIKNFIINSVFSFFISALSDENKNVKVKFIELFKSLE